jgi:ubiquinone/menaquinone biosynthesis C-methylase UbiE
MATMKELLAENDAGGTAGRRAFFDARAASWDAAQEGRRPSPALLAGSLGLRPGDHVLEIGAGTGWLAPAVAGRIAPGRLYLLDISPRMLAQAAVRPLDGPLVILVAEASDIPLPDAWIDRVLMVNTFSLFTDHRPVLSEIARILRPGGSLDLISFATREEVNSHHRKHPALAGTGIPSRDRLGRLLAEHGYRHVQEEAGEPFRIRARFIPRPGPAGDRAVQPRRTHP